MTLGGGKKEEAPAKTGTAAAKKLPLEWEDKPLPLNTYSNKKPFTGEVVSNERCVGPKATGETCNIVIRHNGDMPYWEGQSYGVIPPGENPKKPGKPNTVRLYSIASSRYGDYYDGMTATLCVRRATYWDPELGAEDPAKKGICSNFLCDAQPGEKVTMTGPAGKVMLIPEGSEDKTHIMVATGTGIAPFRSYMKRMFKEQGMGLSSKWKFTGKAWLFMGVANSDALLYDDEFQEYLENFPDQFQYDLALSREQQNKSGGKMYIQDKVEEYADEVFDLLFNQGAHIYFCGLKGMMPGISSMLEGVAKSKGMEWEPLAKQLKKNNQWHVEVY
jgi:ferredoxin--NADP+ reductase